jgi:hypothetical protein
MDNRADAEDVADFLIDYFNMLLGTYSNEFINNIEETRKTSLINDNNMFVGYIVLARRMFENNIYTYIHILKIFFYGFSHFISIC